MKFLLTLGKVVVFFLLAILSYWYWYSHGLYNTGESDKFKLRVGETVFFKLDHNGSTGYSEFWANDSLAKCVSLERTSYHSPVWSWGLIAFGLHLIALGISFKNEGGKKWLNKTIKIVLTT